MSRTKHHRGKQYPYVKTMKPWQRLFWGQIRSKVRDLLRYEIEPEPTRPRNGKKWDVS